MNFGLSEIYKPAWVDEDQFLGGVVLASNVCWNLIRGLGRGFIHLPSLRRKKRRCYSDLRVVGQTDPEKCFAHELLMLLVLRGRHNMCQATNERKYGKLHFLQEVYQAESYMSHVVVARYKYL